MSKLHIIEADFSGGTHAVTTAKKYQFSYGQQLKISGIEDLPESFEVHFSNRDRCGKTKTKIGENGVVSIPDEFFLHGEPVYAFVVLHDEETDGQTIYKVTVPVVRRPKPTEEKPTAVERSIISDAITALNAAKTETAENAERAETAADAAEEAASKISDEHIEEVVQDYMDEHPVTVEESDPTVPEWAKQPEKPTYTAQEVGALPADTQIPTKLKELNEDSAHRPVTDQEKAAWNRKLDTETDPTVPAWAKQPNKPSYTAAEVGALPSSTVIPGDTSELTNGAGFLDAAGVKTLLATEPVIPATLTTGWASGAGYLINLIIAAAGSTSGLQMTGCSADDYSEQYSVDIPSATRVQQMINDTIAALDATGTSY